MDLKTSLLVFITLLLGNIPISSLKRRTVFILQYQMTGLMKHKPTHILYIATYCLYVPTNSTFLYHSNSPLFCIPRTFGYTCTVIKINSTIVGVILNTTMENPPKKLYIKPILQNFKFLIRTCSLPAKTLNIKYVHNITCKVKKPKH